MPWVVGIDEAGYGPNLGPLVQAAVALKLPDDDPGRMGHLAPDVPEVRRAGRWPGADRRLEDGPHPRHGLAAGTRLSATVGLAAGPCPLQLGWGDDRGLPRTIEPANVAFDGTEPIPLHRRLATGLPRPRRDADRCASSSRPRCSTRSSIGSGSKATVLRPG